MALSITIDDVGTFTASLGAVPGPKGDTGATGPSGVVSATAPITYDSGTQTVGISATPTFTSVTATTGNLTTVNLTTATFADATSQTTAFVGEARKVYVTARNNTGSTIAAGKVVYLSGATGNKPTVALALASGEATSDRTIGLTVEAIANNADGKVIISGAAENIDTSAFNAGDVVYLSASVAGGMTTTLPTQPYHGVVIGVVTRANPSVGSVEVAINNYQELQELSDVLVASKANLDLLSWDSASGTWQNKTFATLGLLTSATAASTYAPIVHTHTASQISDSTTAGRALLTAADASAQRTSLGLGTMATETAANYALLASPTFTGDPKAPTPATSDNDTSIATTAFVNAYAPAASTTTAGKVELATNAEARIATDTSRAVTPEDVREMLLYGGYNVTPVFLFNTTATSGTGAISARSAFNGWTVQAPTSVTGSAYAAAGLRNSRRGARDQSRIDYSEPLAFGARLSQNSTGTIDTNSVFRIAIGKLIPFTVGDTTSSQYVIMVRIAGGSALELVVANGTTLTTVTSSYTPSNQSAFDLVVTSDGAGNVTLFVNGSSVATTSDGPTLDSTVTANVCMSIEVENTAELTNTRGSWMATNFNLYTAG